ncbi:hypothetical protein [Helicobacter sp. 23-1045]
MTDNFRDSSLTLFAQNDKIFLADSTNFVRDSAIFVFKTIEVMAVVLWIIFA